MRKIFGVLLSVLCICCAAIGLTGCKKDKHIHAFDKHVITDEYKATDATCTEAATYYYSCECGEKGTETFTSGNALGHSFTNYVSDNNATCTEDGTKTAKCDRCNEKDTVIAIGTKLGHSFTNYVSDNNATCTEDGTKTAKCDRCDKKNTVRDIDSKLHHSYTEQIVSDEYLAAPATCTEKATYYYSCKCGEKGTETFEYGSITNHNFVNGRCTYCGKEQEASKGLEFTLLDDGTYEVSGIGGCTDTEIVIPSIYNDNPVTVIGFEAFKRCKQLKSVIIPKGVTIIKEAAFERCSGLTSVIMPNSIITIGDNAFDCCYYIETAIPENVVTIGDFAFYFCEMINTEIVIPKSAVSIGKGAFAGCTKVEKITVDNDNPVYYSNGNCIIEKASKTLVSGCGNSIIPNDVVAIADSAFEGCFRLMNVTIPDSVTTIGQFAFCWCQNLTSIVIGHGVKNIKDSAFRDCYKMVEVINNSSLEITKSSDENGSVGYYALNVKKGGTTDIVNKDGYLFYAYEKVNYLIGYADTSLNEKNLILPESYNGENYEINQFAFTACLNLISILIPDCVTRMGDYAFLNCGKLTNVSIPDSVANVNSGTFMDSVNLQYNEYGNALYLGNSDNPYAFLLRPKNIDIASCIINKNTKSIESGVFAECIGLTSIIVEKNNPIYYSENNCIIEKSSKKLIAGCRDSVIPNDVKIIGDYAFNNCIGLKSITIPNSVTSIGDSAFDGCSGLTSVTIPDSVTSIGDNAFWGCSGLTIVSIGNSVTSIGDYAFYDCGGLTSVTIPGSVTSIGNSAFCDCSGLKNITYTGTIADWKNIDKGFNWKDHVPITCIIHCTDGDIKISD